MHIKLCKICKKRIFILILALVSMAEFFLLYKDRCSASEQYDIKNVIESCFDAREDENGNVLYGDALLAAGSTDGDWLAFACGRYEKDDAYEMYLGALKDYVASCYRKNSYGLNRSKATEWHRIALAVLACGGDPEAFGTDAEGKDINLIADGTYGCMIGEPWKQGLNGAAYALITLDSRQYAIPDGALYTREDCIDHILGKEIADGGFSLDGKEADADVTAIVLQSLAPYYDTMPEVKEAVDRALDKLSLMQLSSGDFESYGNGSVESTAQVLTALTALGVDVLSDERFIKEGNTVIDGLMMYFDEDKKGFCHILGDDVNEMATAQSLYALISYMKYKDGSGRLYDFTKKELDTNQTAQDPGIQAPPSVTQTPPASAQIPLPAAQTQSPKERESASKKSYAAGKKTQTDTSKKDKGSDHAPKKKTVKKVETVTKIIKSKDITIRKKAAYVTKKELDKIAGTEHNLKIITKTKDGIPYKVTFNGKDILKASDMDLRMKSKSRYENEIRSAAENPYIMSVKTKNGLKCDAFIELCAGLKDGEYLLMKYDAKEKKPVLINKINSKNNVLRFVISSGGEYFAAKKVKLSAASETAAADNEGTSEGKSDIFVPPKVKETSEKAPKSMFITVHIVISIIVIALSALMIGTAVYRKKTEGKEI